MEEPKLTLAQVRQLNDASRQRSLELRKSKTISYLVREVSSDGNVATIKTVTRRKY